MTRRFRTLLLAGAVFLALGAAPGAAGRVAGRGAAKTGTPPPVPRLGPDDSIELPAADWIDLLPLVVTERDSQWKLKMWDRVGSSIVTSPKTGNTSLLTIPVVPRGSYEVEVKFMAAAGNGYVYILLPAGEGCVSLTMCDKTSKAFQYANIEGEPKGLDGVSGLEAIDGQFAAKNPTARRITLQPKVLHTAHVTVNRDDDRRRVTITAKLDGTLIARWSGKQELLLAQPQRHKKHLGLAARKMPVSFRSVRLKMLSGKAYAELPAKRRAPTKTSGMKFKIRRTAP